MALQHAIMTALLEGEMSGYELAKSFDSTLGHFWRATHQQIYQDLRKLTENNWLSNKTITQGGKPNKILYSLTPDGLQALDEWVLSDSKHKSSKDDLPVKLYNLSVKNVGHIIAELEQRQVKVKATLTEYEEMRCRYFSDPDSLPVRRKGIYIALTAGISQAEQFLRWCDETLQLLASVKEDSSTPQNS